MYFPLDCLRGKHQNWRMPGDYVVIRSELIENSREARRYYEERLAGLHVVKCHGREVALFFESAANHVYTEERRRDVNAVALVRRLKSGDTETRYFCMDRALLMDQIIPAVQNFTFSIPGTASTNRENRLLHGPRLRDGRYLRVALSPGPRGTWHCKSAYPIEADKWMSLRGAKTAKFP
jgi:hypothetical protein